MHCDSWEGERLFGEEEGRGGGRGRKMSLEHEERRVEEWREVGSMERCWPREKVRRQSESSQELLTLLPSPPHPSTSNPTAVVQCPSREEEETGTPNLLANFFQAFRQKPSSFLFFFFSSQSLDELASSTNRSDRFPFYYYNISRIAHCFSKESWFFLKTV